MEPDEANSKTVTINQYLNVCLTNSIIWLINLYHIDVSLVIKNV